MFHPQIQGPIGHTAGKHKHLEREKESPSPSSPAGTRVTWTRLSPRGHMGLRPSGVGGCPKRPPPVVEEGTNNLGTNGVQLQVRNVVEIFLAGFSRTRREE